MILVKDDFLPKEAFKDLQQYCNENEFQIVDAGGKEFSVLHTPRNLLEFFRLPGYELVLTFIRSAHKDFDTDHRIHADNIINGHKTELASVLYLNDEGEIDDNGTAFYIHVTHGRQLGKTATAEEFDRLIKEDSNDLSKWKMTDKISSVPNRQLLYSSNYFHAKWPNIIERGERRVLVCFYAKKENTIGK